MKILVSVFQGRISPVFDVAKELLIVEVQGAKELGRREARVEETEVSTRAGQIVRIGAHVLICGAVSESLESMLTSAGVWVIPNTCGPVEEVLKAFISSEFGPRSFLMPGCCGRRRQFWGHNGAKQ
jgi:predicted Fe-Mo cluster-binding NifX family protein